MSGKVQEQLQKEVDIFQKLQRDLQKLINARQQLDSQYNENKTVKDELDVVKPPSNVYKLNGPVLIKQDVAEAKITVQKRMDYIQAELNRHDKSISDMQEKQEKQREVLAKLQQQYQFVNSMRAQGEGMKV